MDPRIETLLEEARKAARIDKERIELFETMVRTPAWDAYIELLNAKLQMFSDELLVPAQSVDKLVALEYIKGAMSGLIIARDIPSVTIAGKEQLRGQPAGLDAEEMEDDDDIDN